MLSTVAQGTRFQLFNTSEDTPLCVSKIKGFVYHIFIFPLFSLQTYYHYMQIAGETFEIITSDVLQGSKVILDVEEEGINERTILSLDAATKISQSGITCVHSSDGKEHCFADAQPGECKSFADHNGIVSCSLIKKVKRSISTRIGD